MDFKSFKEGQQLMNHIANIHELTTKSGLNRIVDTIKGFQVSREYFASAPSSLETTIYSKLANVDSWWPKTYQTNIVADAQEILAIKKEENMAFIDKPEKLNQGKGINVVFDVEYIKEKYWGNHLLKEIYFNYVDNLEKVAIDDQVQQPLQNQEDNTTQSSDDKSTVADTKQDKRFMSIRGKCKYHEQKPKVIQR